MPQKRQQSFAGQASVEPSMVISTGKANTRITTLRQLQSLANKGVAIADTPIAFHRSSQRIFIVTPSSANKINNIPHFKINVSRTLESAQGILCPKDQPLATSHE